MKQTFFKVFLLFFITIILTNCEKDSLDQIKQQNVYENYIVRPIALNDFIKSNVYETFKKNIISHKKK